MLRQKISFRTLTSCAAVKCISVPCPKCARNTAAGSSVTAADSTVATTAGAAPSRISIVSSSASWTGVAVAGGQRSLAASGRPLLKLISLRVWASIEGQARSQGLVSRGCSNYWSYKGLVIFNKGEKVSPWCFNIILQRARRPRYEIYVSDIVNRTR
jgi:hypothetical protein